MDPGTKEFKAQRTKIPNVFELFADGGTRRLEVKQIML